jgi:hypothetical protein
VSSDLFVRAAPPAARKEASMSSLTVAARFDPPSPAIVDDDGGAVIEVALGERAPPAARPPRSVLVVPDASTHAIRKLGRATHRLDVARRPRGPRDRLQIVAFLERMTLVGGAAAPACGRFARWCTTVDTLARDNDPVRDCFCSAYN